ncbi:hypothetical protein [Salipiger sp. PrR003]|uniref:hypothetical protein n=1 Tax=Salipiger sp. PrR003 TaxID=2706776 RepID=UPI0013DC785A|nr:hypothetical protein [Salipiger sp. PrR003]NDV50163.1 hypothetical protein [Salipiger sp. PrR003]
MTSFDVIMSAGSVLAAGASVVHMAHLFRTSGREAPNDPIRVRRFVENAPYEGIYNILSK